MLKFDEPFRNKEIFFKSSDFIFRSKNPWIRIFADPDPGSQNLADPMDPNPKHWLKFSF